AADDLLQFLLEGRELLLQFLLALLGQLREFLGREHFAIVDRCEGEAVRRLDQADAVTLRFFVEVGERLRVALGELGLDAFDFVRVALRFESSRYGRLQFLDELAHVLLQHHAARWRQADREWARGRCEVVDVDPVERVAALATLPDRALDRTDPAAAGRAGHEEVVAVGVDRERELDRPARAIVPDRKRAGIRRIGRDGRLGRTAGGRGYVGFRHAVGIGATRQLFWREAGHWAPVRFLACSNDDMHAVWRDRRRPRIAPTRSRGRSAVGIVLSSGAPDLWIRFEN